MKKHWKLRLNVILFMTFALHFIAILSKECFAQNVRLQGIICNLEPKEKASDFTEPVKSANGTSWKVTNDFGNVVTNVDIPGLPSGYWQHTGIDYLLNGRSVESQGQSVYAAANGVVVFSTGIEGNKNPLPRRGGMVIIRHLAPQGRGFYMDGFERIYTAGKQTTTVTYPAYRSNEVLTYYLHLDPEEILVKQGDQVSKGQEIAKLYESADYKSGKYAYPPHLHFEVWIRCVEIERNGYDGFGAEFRNGVSSPVLDPLTFLSSIRVGPVLTDPSRRETSPRIPSNVALGKSVRVTASGVDPECGYCGQESADITDGSLEYRPASDQLTDGSVGWVNNIYGKTMTVTVTINLQEQYRITKIRYNMGNVERAETWGADLMITPFGSSKTNPGSPYGGAWTEHEGSITASSITVVLKKRLISEVTDWLFIGEIEIIGVPVN